MHRPPSTRDLSIAGWLLCALVGASGWACAGSTPRGGGRDGGVDGRVALPDAVWPDVDRHLACGNGLLDPGETCDDLNRAGGDGCDEACLQEPFSSCPGVGLACTVCGDGVAAGLEACDDANHVDGDGCDQACSVEAGWDCSLASCVALQCGDGIRAGAETCDDANRRSGDGCDFRCRTELDFVCVGAGVACRRAVCGDGAIEAREECDDGGVVAGDGCDEGCRLEAGYACVVGAGCHRTVCGDGAREGREACDDGDSVGGDGCSALCALEDHFACPRAGEACVGIECGDGAVEGNEGCDDDNVVAGDGCDAECRVEALYRCVGGPSRCAPFARWVSIADFSPPNPQAEALHYDPHTRSFVAYDFDVRRSEGVEFCLDGTAPGPLVTRRRRANRLLDGRLDGAAYDPFTDRFLFLEQTGRLTEVDARTEVLVARTMLPVLARPPRFPGDDEAGDDVAGAVAVGDDGRVYVAYSYREEVYGFDRNADPARSLRVVPASRMDMSLAPTSDLDTLISIPGERMLVHYDHPPESPEVKMFSFESLEGGLEGRSTFPGTLFTNGEPYPYAADGGDSAADAGYFVLCSQWAMGVGVCNVFAPACASDVECANRVSGTACKLDAPYPYCYPRTVAGDDRYRVTVGAAAQRLAVLENDAASSTVCHGFRPRVVSVTPTERGGVASILEEGGAIAYAPAASGSCGYYDAFEYRVDLGSPEGGGSSVIETAKVTVLVACVCGNGTVEPGEGCDDHGVVSGDGCDALCRREPECGNGTIEPGETCDDHNLTPGDGCSPTCAPELI